MAGNVDPTIARKIAGLKAKKSELEIADLTASLPGLEGAEREELAARIATMREENDQAQLEVLLDHVRRFPTAHDDRMILCQILVRLEDYEQALGHLQTLARTPRFKLAASLLLGRCFMHNKQYDMAESQFDTVIKGSRGMDTQKKEALYYLGSSLKARGEDAKALATFKEIYSSDLNFKDVRQLVENPDGQKA
jgi:tetratricopeptide (TPR) repeat protein